MKKTLTRTRGKRWCRVEIELREGNVLSICGAEGRILKRAAAKREALEYWRSFFDESPEELAAMNKRFDRRFGPAGAAKFVIESDGEFHGLDVDGPETASEVYIGESYGQIRDSIIEWFPEVAPYLKYHLNDMKAACEHQEAEGWDKRPIDLNKPLDAYGKHFPGQSHDSWNMLAWVRPDEHEGGLLGVPCPTCGYKYGTKWLKRELPAEVRAWAEGFPGSMASGGEVRA